MEGLYLIAKTIFQLTSSLQSFLETYSISCGKYLGTIFDGYAEDMKLGSDFEPTKL